MNAIDILQIVAVIVNIYIAFTKKKNVYIATFVFNMVNLVVYIFMKDYVSIASYILISTRSLLYICKDKFHTKLIPIVFIIMHIVFGLCLLDRPIQLLSILAPCTTCTYMWISKTEQHLRIGNIIVATIWGVYNFSLGLYGIFICRIITIIANAISLYMNRKFKV